MNISLQKCGCYIATLWSCMFSDRSAPYEYAQPDGATAPFVTVLLTPLYLPFSHMYEASINLFSAWTNVFIESYL